MIKLIKEFYKNIYVCIYGSYTEAFKNNVFIKIAVIKL